jgi:hypothetical protein
MSSGDPLTMFPPYVTPDQSSNATATLCAGKSIGFGTGAALTAIDDDSDRVFLRRPLRETDPADASVAGPDRAFNRA